MTTRTLYWITQDLRLQDNDALTLARDSHELLCVYIVDPNAFQARRWQFRQMGSHRWNFIQQCLSRFNQQLLAMGQQLHVRYGNTLSELQTLCARYDINQLITAHLPGTDEKTIIETFGRLHPSVNIHLVDHYTLFNAGMLPFPVSDLPGTYSRFRRQVEHLPVVDPKPSVHVLPGMPKKPPAPCLTLPSWIPTPTPDNERTVFEGGEIPGQIQLARYFRSAHPAHYKAERNHLNGWFHSTKLSPWLNQGCLSPRQVRAAIIEYESASGRNESTEWLYVELLWREYFQWLHHKIGSTLFRFAGITGQPPLTSFYAERFNKWRLGLTPYPLVNACMNELRHTGYLSNRGRQIAASCLVNELSVDWRYGAAWFEHLLIDYDVAVNWGNWQYIAGVGVDPRGGRHFNLEKQTELYDPDGRYRERWQGSSVGPLDSVDAADWPITTDLRGITRHLQS